MADQFSPSPQSIDESPQKTMANIIRGYQLSQVVCVMAQLGIADLLANRSCSADELAQATNTDSDSLKRLLHTLASFNIVMIDESEKFSLTPLGSTLRSDTSNSLRYMAMTWCHPAVYNTWSNLIESIRTGNPTFKNTFGTDFYSYLNDNTEWNFIFNKGMGSMDRHTELTSLYDFSNTKCVLDVGGGKGTLMMHLLCNQPNLTGILYDLPHVIDDAQKVFTDEVKSDILNRLKIVAGDMFVSVPTGADTIILSHILMNFDRSKVKLLLDNCRAAVNTGAKLLIIEVILRDNTSQPAGRLNDLNMLVLLSGRHQHEQEYLTLLKQSNFIVESNIQMKCDENILVCRAI